MTAGDLSPSVSATASDDASQLLLPIDLPVLRTFGNFVVTPENRAVIEHLRHLTSGDTECNRQVVLWGRRGVGKTHLLQAVYHMVFDKGMRVAWVPMRKMLSQSGDMLSGLHQVPVVCIDDIDVIGLNSDWQFALFRLMNAVRDRDGVLLMASSLSPHDMSFLMRDVSSRLLGGTVYRLCPMSDEELVATMKQYAKTHDYALSEQVAQYLVNNFPRDLTTLTGMLDRMGNESRVQQRKMTVPLAKELFGANKTTAP